MRCLILSRSVIARLLASRLVLPFLKPSAYQLGRARRVLDVAVPEIALQRTGIAPTVGELVTTAMPQLIRMDEPGRLADQRQCRTPASVIRALRSSGRHGAVTWFPPQSSQHAQLFACERMDRQTLTRGCRQMMERNEDRYRFAARPKLHRTALNTASRFLLGSADPFLPSGIRPRQVASS